MSINTLFPEASGAVISECQHYRYALRRDWDSSRWPLTVIMLNPSTADASLDDPTIRRCIGFARAYLYGGLRVLNLFAFRATDPAVMKATADPVGPDNDRHIRAALADAKHTGADVVAAWGVHGVHMGRDAEVKAMAKAAGVTLTCLGTTKEGHPRHPLYVPGAQEFVRLP